MPMTAKDIDRSRERVRRTANALFGKIHEIDDGEAQVMEGDFGQALVIMADREKDTKNSIRYTERTPSKGMRGYVGTIYLLKEAAEHMGVKDEICIIIGGPLLADILVASASSVGGKE